MGAVPDLFTGRDGSFFRAGRPSIPNWLDRHLTTPYARRRQRVILIKVVVAYFAVRHGLRCEREQRLIRNGAFVWKQNCKLPKSNNGLKNVRNVHATMAVLNTSGVPGDFGLDPPSSPRPGKTLCDVVQIHTRVVALALLRTGLRKGMFSVQERGGWPQNVWAVTDDGEPLEAQLEGEGVYHGYPMPQEDPFRENVLARWNRL